MSPGDPPCWAHMIDEPAAPPPGGYAAAPRAGVVPRFAVGDRVRIADRTPPLHHRVPGYVKGAAGVVESVRAAYGRPEGLGHGDDGEPAAPIYRVRIAQTALWSAYAENPADVLEIEIFEHWLTPAA